MSDENVLTPGATMEHPPSSSGDAVQVFCRLRPLKTETELCYVKLLSPTTLTLTAETKLGRKECNYVFRHIFTSYAGQREVFEYVALPLLEGVVDGRNGLLFTYGVTGSGKTYTLTGEPTLPGIMPRCINTLFNSIGEIQAQKFLIKSDRMNGFEVQSEEDALEDRLKDAKSTRRAKTPRKAAGDARLYENDGLKALADENCLYSVFVSYWEIYNNTVYDLLDESAGKVLQAKIIREDPNKNMYVNGAVELEVKNAGDAFDLFFLGQKRKRMGITALNADSSRSHSIFNIRVVQLQPTTNFIKVGQLSLVDLAGSERCRRTHNTGMRLKEASSINNSLMSLRTCLEILRENQMSSGSKLVPYRDSRLTLLFKGFFEGEGQVRMIVCINPSAQDCEENLQVLKFAEMSQDVKIPRVESRYTPYRKARPKTPVVQTPGICKSKRALPFTFGPKISSIKLSMEDPTHNVAVCDNLLKTFQLRKQRWAEQQPVLQERQEHFRRRLVQLNQDSVLTRSEIRSMKALMRQKEQQAHNLNMKVVDLEAANENLTKNNEELQDVIRSLHNTINEKNLKINQNHLEHEKAKQKLALRSEKLTQELDDKLRQQREHLQAAMEAKEEKLKKVKRILDSDTVSVSSEDQEPRPEPRRIIMEEPKRAMGERLSSSRIQPIDIPESEDMDMDMDTEAFSNKEILHRSFSAHRSRARTSGEVWLEHNSVKPVPLGTVLQPVMKKRKSVTKLKKAADVVHSRQNKYCLIAQETDSAGDIETKVYKADIVPTCGGGAQVIFNDVERLRQESPIRSPSSAHK